MERNRSFTKFAAWSALGLSAAAGAFWLIESRQPLVASSPTRATNSVSMVAEADPAPAAEATQTHDRLSIALPPEATAPEAAAEPKADPRAKVKFEHPWMRGEEPALMEKYSKMSLEELHGAHDALALRTTEEGKRISDELMRSGRAEVEVVPEGQKATGFGTTDDQPFVTAGFAVEHGANESIVQVAKIDPDEYPEFGKLQRELWWLKNYIHLVEHN